MTTHRPNAPNRRSASTGPGLVAIRASPPAAAAAAGTATPQAPSAAYPGRARQAPPHHTGR